MKQFIKGSEFGKLLETSSVVGASVVRRNFSESIFNNYELFLPNLEEQEKIAQVLTLADREIDLYQQQLDKLKLEKNPSCNNYSQDKNG
jgi:type I restriction enzyme S subunit